MSAEGGLASMSKVRQWEKQGGEISIGDGKEHFTKHVAQAVV